MGNRTKTTVKYTDPAWHWQGVPLLVPPAKTVGFVYTITNNATGQAYIGKKLFNKDWITYWGSNPRLHADVLEQGPENFSRTIIALCPTRSQMSYIEAREQFRNAVLYNDRFYNDCIIVKINRRQAGKPGWTENI